MIQTNPTKRARIEFLEFILYKINTPFLF